MKNFKLFLQDENGEYIQLYSRRRRRTYGYNWDKTGLERQFVAYFHFVRWSCFSLGFHVDVAIPNIEIHIPFGFIRIGWTV